MINLHSLDDPRANKLLKELDARYFHFSESLPAFLRRLAESEDAIYGGQGDGTFKGPSTLNPLITCSPWLFWETFNQLDDEIFIKVATSGMFVSLYSVLLDHLVDGQANPPGLHALLVQSFYQKGASGFRELFDNVSPFWHLYDQYFQEYISSLGIEKDAQVSHQELPYDLFTKSAGGKVAPMLITIAALTLATDQTHLLSTIENSLRYSYIAGQLHDDVLDWRHDLEADHITFVITFLLPDGASVARDYPSLAKLEQIVDRDKKDLQIYRMVIDWFDRAIRAVDDIECPRWIAYLQDYQSVAQEHQKSSAARHLRQELSSLFPP